MQTHFWKNYLVSFESSFEATDTMVSDLRKSKKSQHILQLFSKVKWILKFTLQALKVSTFGHFLYEVFLFIRPEKIWYNFFTVSV